MNRSKLDPNQRTEARARERHLGAGVRRSGLGDMVGGAPKSFGPGGTAGVNLYRAGTGN